MLLLMFCISSAMADGTKDISINLASTYLHLDRNTAPAAPSTSSLLTTVLTVTKTVSRRHTTLI